MTDMRARFTTLLLVALAMAGAAPVGQETGLEPLVRQLESASARDRQRALEQLGALGRPDAVLPIAARLDDEHDGVQRAAVGALLGLYTVRADLGRRQWGPGSPGKPVTESEVAFEAGPLATMPARVPAEAVTGLSALVRQGRTPRTRLEAAYALGTLATPFVGPMTPEVAERVAVDLAAALTHPDKYARQVAARVAGRVFFWSGRQAPATIGDALVAAMNDDDALVRRWAMDALGWMRYERAVQALTERASYHGRGEEGSAALHALARIASPVSAPVFRARLGDGAPAFRVIAIEGLARIGDTTALAAIAESAADARQVNVTLAYRMAEVLMAQTTDLTPFVAALRNGDTAIQARVYLAELADLQPNLLYPLLRSEDPWVRRGTAEILGTTRRPAEDGLLQPLLKDPAPEVVEAASEAIRRLRAYAALGIAP